MLRLPRPAGAGKGREAAAGSATGNCALRRAAIFTFCKLLKWNCEILSVTDARTEQSSGRPGEFRSGDWRGCVLMSVALCCGWAWEMQCRGRAAACRWVGARGRHGGLRGLEFQELGDGSRRIRHPTAEIETGKTSGAASCDVIPATIPARLFLRNRKFHPGRVRVLKFCVLC